MKSKSILVGIFLFAFLLSMNLVLSAPTSNTPVEGEAINGTYVFNVTNGTTEYVNCTWSTTLNSDFAFTANTTASQTNFTNSTDTTTLNEEHDTTLTITCYNSTGYEDSTTLTISIDNTAPTCSFEPDRITVTWMDLLGINPVDLSSDTTTLTYLWTLWDEEGNSITTSTSSAPNFANDDFALKGENILGLTVTDEVSKSTDCTNTTIFVTGEDNEEGAVAGELITGATGGYTIYIILGIVLLVIILVVVGFYTISKSKKR